MKVCGLLAEEREITDEFLTRAALFLREDIPPLVAKEGEDDGPGFVVIHPGDAGLSISAHWWIRGSVLRQRDHRQLYGADAPVDTIARPVIGCVRELAIVNAEQEAWRDITMSPAPDRAGYLAGRATFAFA